MALDTGKVDKESAAVKGYLPRSIKAEGMKVIDSSPQLTSKYCLELADVMYTYYFDA